MEELNRMDREVEAITKRMEAREGEGVANVHKHFDRIHDQLIGFNNMLIAGFFTLSQLYSNVPPANILWPLLNLAFMIFLEYRMMETNRILASIMSVSAEKREQYGKGIERTNIYSLLMIVSTVLITCVFLWLLYKGVK